MYFIYHVHGIKIGCTENLRKRVEQQQGYKNYDILFKTNCIEEASKKEIFYQEQYGYKKDKESYSKLKFKNMLHITDHSITFKGTTKDTLFEKILDKYTIDNIEFNINEECKEWILKNAIKSQYSEEMFVYREPFLNKILKTNEYDNFFNSESIEIFDKIREWAKNKGILEKGDPKTQCIKLFEEAGELSKSILKNDEEEFIDAIGDCVVVLTNLSALKGYKIEDCINSAYNVIAKRTGKMENGTFVKE